MAKSTAKSRVKRARPAGKRAARPATRKVNGKKAPQTRKPSKKTSRAKKSGESAKAKDKEDFKRKLGLRGAAPWAARHAAKHAAEARARNSEPAPPGSARATLRTPEAAEEIKARIGELHQRLTRVRDLRKHLSDDFYDLGEVLQEVRDHRLYEAKGYGSFEAFLDREIDLGKATSLQLVRVPEVFQREAALAAGLDACLNALRALDTPRDPNRRPSTLPMKPPGSNGRG